MSPNGNGTAAGLGPYSVRGGAQLRAKVQSRAGGMPAVCWPLGRGASLAGQQTPEMWTECGPRSARCSHGPLAGEGAQAAHTLHRPAATLFGGPGGRPQQRVGVLGATLEETLKV